MAQDPRLLGTAAAIVSRLHYPPKVRGSMLPVFRSCCPTLSDESALH